MIDNEKANEWLDEYLSQFGDKWWSQEGYKWQAIKVFQDNFDIDAENFKSILGNSLSATDNLLDVSTGKYKYLPRLMLLEFCDIDVEKVRSMFKELYDESGGSSAEDRIQEFRKSAEEFMDKRSDWSDKNSYQDLRAVSVYLWLKFPDKYYIYKPATIKILVSALGSDFDFIKKTSNRHPNKDENDKANLRGAFELYEEMRAALLANSAAKEALGKYLDGSCWPDQKLVTMAIDFGWYISHPDKDEENPEEFPSKDQYDPKLSKEDWVELLKDESVVSKDARSMLDTMLKLGGSASMKSLADVTGKPSSSFTAVATDLAKKVQAKTQCPIPNLDENSKWWPIAFTGHHTKKDKGEKGSYVWTLREPLKAALESLSEPGGAPEQSTNPSGYWWINCNPKIWSISTEPVGKEQTYSLLNENGNPRRVQKHFQSVRPGDPVIAYETSPVKKIVALAVITRGNDGRTIAFAKKEGLSTPVPLHDIQADPILKKSEPMAGGQGSLFSFTKEEYDEAMDLVRQSNPEPIEQTKPYDEGAFLNEVYVTADDYKTLIGLLKAKKNIILCGAPGVGKTFAAKRLAYSILGKKDDSHVQMVQFHQSYSYEDFVQGYKPIEDGGFELKNGVFYDFCQRAMQSPNENFFFVIDEINRGNLSKIFGELLMLIESSHRGDKEKIKLAYSDMPFWVPENLYIIGMMNTADRSLAMMDYALRRRFAFFNMGPAFDNPTFQKYAESLAWEHLNEVIGAIRDLNKEIREDPTLGDGFQIGHSYFCNFKEPDDERLNNAILYEIIPLIQEYWMDEEGKRDKWVSRLKSLTNDQR